MGDSASPVEGLKATECLLPVPCCPQLREIDHKQMRDKLSPLPGMLAALGRSPVWNEQPADQSKFLAAQVADIMVIASSEFITNPPTGWWMARPFRNAVRHRATVGLPMQV